MRYWNLLLFVLLITGCDGAEREQEYNKIKIEKTYPYLCKKISINDIDEGMVELFKNRIFPIDSDIQLYENSLFDLFSEELKEELGQCDFNKYTLIVASSSVLNEVTDLEFSFWYNTYFSEYTYNQTVYSKPLVDPIEAIYLTINLFATNKIPDNSKLIYNRATIREDSDKWTTTAPQSAASARCD